MDVWWIFPGIALIAMIGVLYAVLRSRGTKMDRMEQQAAAAPIQSHGRAEQETDRATRYR